MVITLCLEGLRLEQDTNWHCELQDKSFGSELINDRNVKSRTRLESSKGEDDWKAGLCIPFLCQFS